MCVSHGFAGVGLSVGGIVGRGVGGGVGGTGVGLCVGTAVGACEGATVGLGVGCGVGGPWHRVAPFSPRVDLPTPQLLQRAVVNVSDARLKVSTGHGLHL